MKSSQVEHLKPIQVESSSSENTNCNSASTINIKPYLLRKPLGASTSWDGQRGPGSASGGASAWRRLERESDGHCGGPPRVATAPEEYSSHRRHFALRPENLDLSVSRPAPGRLLLWPRRRASVVRRTRMRTVSWGNIVTSGTDFRQLRRCVCVCA